MRTEDGYMIHQCRSGDPTAFGFLVEKYKAGVYAFAYAKLRNFCDAEDVSQALFLKAYKSLRVLRPWDSFASWLYRMTLSLCNDRSHTQSRCPDHEFIEDQEQAVSEVPSGNNCHREPMCESVREGLDSLPGTYRDALILHCFGGMTIRDIAGATGASPTDIGMRISRAKAQLKAEMIATMAADYDKRRLQADFTFRIVEMVKHTRIQSAP